MLVIFGLGNPGPRFQFTRHNAGVETLERLAASCQTTLARRCFSSYRSATIKLEEGKEAKLVFPLTYMNNSGHVVPKTVKEGDRVIVICDQMDLPPGRIRYRKAGSSAGHNGLKSMLEYLPDNFERIYIGIGRPKDDVSVVDHVVGRFDEEERKLVDQGEAEAAAILLEVIKNGGMNQKLEQRLNSFVPEAERES